MLPIVVLILPDQSWLGNVPAPPVHIQVIRLMSGRAVERAVSARGAARRRIVTASALKVNAAGKLDS